MRLFRRTHDAKTSVIEREAVSVTTEGDPSAMSLVPPSRPSSPVAPVVERPSQPQLGSSPALDAAEAIEESDVFACRRDDASDAQVAREVTLFVHRWHNVEPGLLSWTFPSLRAALDAVQRMKNAIGWCIVSGGSWRDLDAARAKGAILVEQLS